MVDDDPVIRDLVSHEVRQEVWDVLQAGSDAELTVLLRHLTPDIVLLDIRLPADANTGSTWPISCAMTTAS
nr:response regulator [Thiocapsa bogorovii]